MAESARRRPSFGGAGSVGIYYFQVVLLVALLRLLMETENPLLCASINAGFVLIAGLLFGAAFFPAILETAIAFATAFVWFWLLNRTARSALWWAILVAGLVAPGLIRFALSPHKSSHDREGEPGSPHYRTEAPNR